jgi:hypothetical protein
MKPTHAVPSRRLAFVVGLACLPAASIAAEPEECVRSTTGFGRLGLTHLSVDLPRDLGGGFVEQHFHSGADGEVSTHANLDHCESGFSIRATMSRSNDSGTYEAPTNPADLLREAISSPETFELEEVVEMLRSHGIEAETRSSELESCGCAAFYPELRGPKTPWPGWRG